MRLEWREVEALLKIGALKAGRVKINDIEVRSKEKSLHVRNLV